MRHNTILRKTSGTLYLATNPLIKATFQQIADCKSLFGFDLTSANQHRLFIQRGVSEVMLGSAWCSYHISVPDGAHEPEGKDFLPAGIIGETFLPMLKRRLGRLKFGKSSETPMVTHGKIKSQ